MLKIGVTGLIASGKSEVSKLLSQYTKFPIINADHLAREVTAKGSEAIAEIALEFGNEYIKDGEINRPLLAKKVFSDEEAKNRLNAIVHYRVGIRYEELLERYEKIDVKGIIFDCPLLVEAGAGELVDVVVLVYSSHESQMDRLMNIRSLSKEEAEMRIRVQIPFEVQKTFADIVVENDGTIEELEQKMPALFEEIKECISKKKSLHN